MSGPPPNLRWGWIQWLINGNFSAFDLVFYTWFQGAVEEVDVQCRHLLTPSECHRVSIQIREILSLVQLLYCSPEKVIEAVDNDAAKFCASDEYKVTLEWTAQSWAAS